MKDFFASTKRILSNEMLMFNMFSVVFYVLTTLPFYEYIAKYLEVQFQTSAGGGTVVTGKILKKLENKIPHQRLKCI